MASIEQRGDNTYRISVPRGYNRENKKITPARKLVKLEPGLTDKQRDKELKRLTAEFEQEVKNGDFVSTNLNFEHFAEQWLLEYAEKRLEKTTIESYKGELRTKIYPAIGHVKLKDLKPLHLIRFYQNLTEDGVRLDGKPGGYSSRIIKYQHSIISSILQTAVYWQVLNDNVARRVKPPKGTDKQKGDNFLDGIQIKTFLDYVVETEPLIYQVMAFVTAYGGLRKGEVLGLDWSDISFKDNEIRIDEAYARAAKDEYMKAPKNTTSARTVTLPPHVMKMLKELKVSSTTVRLFPFSYHTPTHWFKRVRDRYNVTHEDKLPPDMTYHGLRHTSATLLIAGGLDVKTVSARIGHADPSTTMRIYAHHLKSRDKAASDVLDKIIGK